MNRQFSPTVSAAYLRSPDWYIRYAGCSLQDEDGYDKFGFNMAGLDRAGHSRNDYKSMSAEDIRWIETCWGFDGIKPVLHSNQVVEDNLAGSLNTQLRLIEQVFEVKHLAHIYRLRQLGNEVSVSRVPEDQPFWHHGVIRQVIDKDREQFVPSIKSDSLKIFDSVDSALNFIKQG